MAVQQGTFRRDLFFRLNVVGLRLPPLRDRKEDIRPLAENFLERVGQARQMQYSINPEALKLLQFYDWPGNVRELENCLERAVAMSPGPCCKPADFPPHIRSASLRAVGPEKQARILPLAELEKQAILDALQQLNGDKLMTARALGIGKTTLYRKLKEYGITHWSLLHPCRPLRDEVIQAVPRPKNLCCQQDRLRSASNNTDGHCSGGVLTACCQKTLILQRQLRPEMPPLTFGGCRL